MASVCELYRESHETCVGMVFPIPILNRYNLDSNLHNLMKFATQIRNVIKSSLFRNKNSIIFCATHWEWVSERDAHWSKIYCTINVIQGLRSPQSLRSTLRILKTIFFRAPTLPQSLKSCRYIVHLSKHFGFEDIDFWDTLVLTVRRNWESKHISYKQVSDG